VNLREQVVKVDRFCSAESLILFTLDVDWVPDKVLSFALEFFKEKGLPVTVFATHKTEVLEAPGEGVEVAIHPNLFGKDQHGLELKGLKEIFPAARGFRTHGLFEYYDLLALAKDIGMEYDSNLLLYRCQGIKPFRHPSGIVRIPMFWEDDDHFTFESFWDPEMLRLESPGLKVLAFHPIHLRLNTIAPEQYQLAKERGLTEEGIREAENRKADCGIRVLAERICELVVKRKLVTMLLREVIDEFADTPSRV
jgi:hypothetical protein